MSPLQSPPPSSDLAQAVDEYEQETSSGSGDDDGLSTGGIVGVVFACVAAVLLVAALVLWQRQRADKRSGSYSVEEAPHLSQVDADGVVTLVEYHEDVTAYHLTWEQEQQRQRGGGDHDGGDGAGDLSAAERFHGAHSSKHSGGGGGGGGGVSEVLATLEAWPSFFPSDMTSSNAK